MKHWKLDRFAIKFEFSRDFFLICHVKITVVGVVSSIQQQATNSVYAIDDGTGRIEARQWVNTGSESLQSDIK